MNTYDIFLKGGQVVTVNSEIGYDRLLNLTFNSWETELIEFEKPSVAFVKTQIIAIRDISNQPVREINLNGLNKPYKPWNEQK